MAWFNENSQFGFGKYKGKKVRDVQDAQYVKWLHESSLNVYFTADVLTRLKVEVSKDGKKKDYK